MPPSNSWVRLKTLSEATDTVAVTALTISLDSRGLAYGDGFFTTMGVIDGHIQWLAHHQQRLITHSQALGIMLDDALIVSQLQTQATRLQQGMLKLLITRAAQEIRGYGYQQQATGSACEVWLKSIDMPIATAQTLSLPNGHVVFLQPTSTAVCLSAQISCLPPSLAGLKTLNRLDNVLASGELQAQKEQASAANSKHSIAEGLLRDMSGQWVEGTMSNVFYQLSEPAQSQDDGSYLSTGQWYTPSMARSGVAGVMRQVIVDGLSTAKRPVIIRSLQEADLPKIKQLFFCNALRGIMPMSRLRLLSGESVVF